MLKKSFSVFCVLVLLMAMLPAALADMTQGDMNKCGNCRIPGGYKVYTGPGPDYYRIGSASMNDTICYVWGYEDNWLLIAYQASKGYYRVGYIDKAALKTAVNVEGNIKNELDFLWDDGKINKKTSITDDPFVDMTSFATLKKGTELFVLGYMGEWTYVEILMDDETPARGFVKTEYIDTDGQVIKGKGIDVPGASKSKKATAAPTKKAKTATPTPVPYVTAVPYVTDVPYVTAVPYVTDVPYVTAVPYVTDVPYVTPVPVDPNASLLRSLTHNCPNTGRMLPQKFDPNVTSYVLTVADWVSRVSFTPTAYDRNAIITVNGQPIASGGTTSYFQMTNDPQQVTINVIAVSGATTTYTIFLQRRPSELRTRVSAGYISDIYMSNNQYYIAADLVTVNYTGTDYSSGNRSNYTNDSAYLYRYAVDVHCDFYYGSAYGAVRASDIFEFKANYRTPYGSGMYTIVYIDDKIVAVYPYESEVYQSQHYNYNNY